MAKSTEPGFYYFTNPKSGIKSWVKVFPIGNHFYETRGREINAVLYQFEDQLGSEYFYLATREEFLSQRDNGVPRFESVEEKRQREARENSGKGI